MGLHPIGRLSGGLSALTILVGSVLAAPTPSSAADSMAAELQKLVASPPPAIAETAQWGGVQAYYTSNPAKPLWLDADAGRELLAALQDAAFEGLDPAHYPTAEIATRTDALAGAAPKAKAETELFLSAAFLEFASDLKTGRLSPHRVDPKLFVKPKQIDGQAVLKALADAKSVRAFLRQWAPQNPEYRGLRRLLATHRKLEANGGWGTLPEGPSLKPGAQDPRVATLRARLSASGDITVPGSDPELYDEALVQAVQSFQTRHGLEPDGVVGPASVRALNVPVGDRVRQIVVNMERWRWLPERLGDRYVIVNIAGFKLHLVDSGTVIDRMRVVVGKPYHRSPVFSDTIKYLEVNPFWTVPVGIATRSLLPKIKEDIGYLRDNNFKVFSNDVAVDPQTIDWQSLSRKRFPYTLRQEPGPQNALGLVKFMFPNRFNVYLHDTPTRDLFGKASRAFSSGCIRLARPFDLAEALVQDIDGWDRERLDATVDSGKRTVINLPEPIPVHLTYATAWTGEGGTINFRPDIYRRDEVLQEALFSGRR
ncbi:MAG: L,D-transpeptidase family protein [Alphaproteobacteria bacterium]|nr:L,D-transpeptidase family protein [Alphaproteobacteria bacterium]